MSPPGADTLLRLDGRVAAITGSGSGIGRAIALLFARRGASVAILERDGDAAAAVAEEITAAGGTAVAIPCDVSEEESVAAAFERLDSELGPVSIVVNNAGIAAVGGVLDTTPEDLDRVYRRLAATLRCPPGGRLPEWPAR